MQMLGLLLAVVFFISVVSAIPGRNGLGKVVQDELAIDPEYQRPETTLFHYDPKKILKWPTSDHKTKTASTNKVFEDLAGPPRSEDDLIEAANEVFAAFSSPDFITTPIPPGPLEVSNAGPSTTSADEPTVICQNSYAALYAAVVNCKVPTESEEEQGQGDTSSKEPVAAGSTNYETFSNGTRSPKAEAVRLILGEGHGVTFLSIADTTQNTTINHGSLSVLSVDYQHSSGTVFFSTRNQIISTDKKGAIIDTGLDGPVRIAVDWVHHRLYWLSDNHQTVESADLDGTNRQLFIDSITNFSYPNNIAVDPLERVLFFVSNHSVYRSDLYGGQLGRILEPVGTNRRVQCLALDVIKKRLYITGKVGNSSTTSYLSSSDYRGLAVADHSLGNKTLNDIFALDVLGNIVYMADYSFNGVDTLWSVDLSQTGSSPNKLYQVPADRGGLYSMRVFHPSVQPNAETEYLNTTQPPT